MSASDGTTNGVTNGATKPETQVLVVGGGPVGTFITLRLARAGIKVMLLEADEVPSSAPRAAVYTGPSVLELQRAGILDDVRAIGLQNSDVCWRKADGEIIAGVKREVETTDPLNPVTLDQFRLETVILKHLEPYSNAQILWGHKVTALEQFDDRVKITAETLKGETVHFESQYVIGADGGKSTVRKLIDVKFEGFTWPFTIGRDLNKLNLMSSRYQCLLPL
jgi:2-polyprenyl-6-methoxyphenol hydroxylase-like FAD-dependent oxidoreductase